VIGMENEGGVVVIVVLESLCRGEKTPCSVWCRVSTSGKVRLDEHVGSPTDAHPFTHEMHYALLSLSRRHGVLLSIASRFSTILQHVFDCHDYCLEHSPCYDSFTQVGFRLGDSCRHSLFMQWSVVRPTRQRCCDVII
jgi:hypothetical protein